MDIRNCKSCGNIFHYAIGPVICPACKESREAQFQQVKQYLEENPQASITKVAEECDVDIQLIRQWLREERLQLSSNASLYLSCDVCGISIRSGKYCDKCKYDMMVGLKNAVRMPAQEGNGSLEEPKGISAKMRFLS